LANKSFPTDGNSISLNSSDFRDVFSRFQGEEEETAHKQHPESRPRSGSRTCHQKIRAKGN